MGGAMDTSLIGGCKPDAAICTRGVTRDFKAGQQSITAVAGRQSSNAAANQLSPEPTSSTDDGAWLTWVLISRRKNRARLVSHGCRVLLSGRSRRSTGAQATAASSSGLQVVAHGRVAIRR